MSVCVSLLASKSSDRSMPQKLFCGSSDSVPTCCSSGPSFRIHSDPELGLSRPALHTYDGSGLQLSSAAQLIRTPVGVMSTVCANWATLSTETLIDSTIFLRGRFTSVQHWHGLTCPHEPCAEHTCYRDCRAE